MDIVNTQAQAYAEAYTSPEDELLQEVFHAFPRAGPPRRVLAASKIEAQRALSSGSAT